MSEYKPITVEQMCDQEKAARASRDRLAELRQQLINRPVDEKIAGSAFEAGERLSRLYGVRSDWSPTEGPLMRWDDLPEREKALRKAVVSELIERGIIHIAEAQRVQELRMELGSRTRHNDRLIADHRALTSEVIAAITSAEHRMVIVGGLPQCICGEPLDGGDASGKFITHALAHLKETDRG